MSSTSPVAVPPARDTVPPWTLRRAWDREPKTNVVSGLVQRWNHEETPEIRRCRGCNKIKPGGHMSCLFDVGGPLPGCDPHHLLQPHPCQIKLKRVKVSYCAKVCVFTSNEEVTGQVTFCQLLLRPGISKFVIFQLGHCRESVSWVPLFIWFLC